MSKTKKGVPVRKDDDSLVEQVPDDKMAALIEGLANLKPVNLAEQKQAQSLAEGSILDTDSLVKSPEDLPKFKPSDNERD